MTVAELIEFLKTQPQGLQVAYRKYSEQCLLAEKDMVVEDLQPVRADGWIHSLWRTDDPKQTYLVLPGN